MGDFNKNFLGSLGTGLGSGVAGMGLSMIGGLFGGIKAKKQHKRNKELLQLQNQIEIERMGLQADLNKQQAEHAQELAKKMYDYTFQNEAEYNNPTNQVARMRAAGLNPALMYGGSAAGAGGVAEGSTSGAGIAGAVSALQPMGLQIALQAEAQKSQIELNQSQAAKNWADAGKTIGIDTLEGKTNVDEANSRILVNKAQNAKTSEEINMILQNIKSLKIQNEVDEETKKAKIDSQLESLNILHQQAALNVIEGLKNETEAKILEKDLKNYDDKLQALFDDVATRKLTADAAWGQYEATKAWLEKQYPNKEAEELKTYTEIGATALGLLLEIAEFIPQAKMLKIANKLKHLEFRIGQSEKREYIRNSKK